MSERKLMRVCRISGKVNERAGIRIAIADRQAKHKSVAGLQARLKEVTNEILRLEVGWEKADQMIGDGEIFSEVKGAGVVKCFRDGSAWCCVGEGFENLQESDNYAFGDTRLGAIENYKHLKGGE